jgi:hypothetical protein
VYVSRGELAWGHKNDCFSSWFSNIDVARHFGDGETLAHQNMMATLFVTILSMIITDAYFAYRFEYRARQQGEEVGMWDY